VRVVFLTHYYPPEAGAPQARISALAGGLTALGWEVTIHTGFPHYPAGRVMAPYRNRPLRRERGAAGERIVRSAIYPTANRGFGRRLANHLSLCASALATAPASGAADVVVVESPPLFLAAAGVLYAAMKRTPLVINVADRWPASAVELGALTDARAIAAAEALERWAYGRAAAVTVPTEGLVRDLGAVPGAVGKVERLAPAVDITRFAALPPPRAAAAAEAPSGPLRVLYAGTVGLAHGIGTLVEAARLAGPDVVEVTIAGGGAEADRLAGGRPANVHVRGVLPPERVPALYAEADAGVVLLRDRPIFAGALPTKLLECLAAGRPAVLSARGEAAALLERSGAGLVTAPEDPAALAEAFRVLHADPALRARLGAAGRTEAARFDRPGSVRAWAELLARVSGPGGRPSTRASAPRSGPAARS
jgi:glycosyltransferase involved in cell wall biosynthesis